MKRDPWHYGTWEGARDATREDNSRLTLAEKIRTLEDMERITLTLHKARHKMGLPVDPKIRPLIEAGVAEEQAPCPQAPDGPLKTASSRRPPPPAKDRTRA